MTNKEMTNRCDSCTHYEEQDGSNCYECVKGMVDNFEARMTNKEMVNRCEYCTQAVPLVIGNSDDKGICLMYPNYLSAYGYDIHGSGSNDLIVKINYCPMCGRELKVKQMTKENEEAIEILKSELDWAEQNRYPYISENKVKAIKLAIKALEQGDVLDKIRAEIEEYKSRQLTLAIGIDNLEKGKQVALEYILGILDKYKVENEG